MTVPRTRAGRYPAYGSAIEQQAPARIRSDRYAACVAAEKYAKESTVKQALLRAQWLVLAFAPIVLTLVHGMGKRWS